VALVTKSCSCRSNCQIGGREIILGGGCGCNGQEKSGDDIIDACKASAAKRFC